MTSDVRVVIIGGGIMGVSLLYHLAVEGWQDCLLLEKGELASGSTWHAAGQITHSTSSYGLAWMTGYGTRKYAELEAETGRSVSWHQPGSLRLAVREDEMDWLRYTLSVGRGVGNRMELVDPAQIAALHPFCNLDGVLGALHTPDDGHVDPAGAVFAFAEGARRKGAAIRRNTRVTGTVALPDGRWRVETEAGSYVCDQVVNAAGTYARQVAAWAGPSVDLPVIPMTHQYFVTEEVPAFADLDGELPVLREDTHVSGYIRMERRAGLIGIYEKADPRSVWESGTPWEADHHLFAPEYDRVAPWLEAAFERVPVLADAGIVKEVHGAITHPPDGNMLLGPAPGLANYWYCTGVQVGISWGPGATRQLATWMVRGAPTLNLRAFDPSRFGGFATQDYNRTKAHEDYLLRHEVPFPDLDRPAGRPHKTSALHHRMARRGAVFEEVFGWERPRWFAADGQAARHHHSFRRARWFATVAREVRAVRQRAGVADLTAFSKFEVAGADAASFLDRLTPGRLPRPGRIGLVYMLTEQGMVEAEFTAARLAEDCFYLVGAAVGELRFLDWMRSHVLDGREGRDVGPNGPERVRIANRSSDLGVLAVAGPRSREVLQPLTGADLSNTGGGWLSARPVDIGDAPALALRLSFTGELGWELHVAMEDLPSVFDAVVESGAAHGLGVFGSLALNSMRMEKAYRVSGDMTQEVSAYEAGLARFVDPAKKSYIGYEALVASRWRPRWKLALLDVDVADVDPLGGEGVFMDGRRVGVVTTTGYGHATGRSLAWAYVDPGLDLPGTCLEVMVLGKPAPAKVLDGPVWDPDSVRPRR